MTARVRVRRALLSVYDKTGLEEVARGLAALGVDLVATGGTARAIRGFGCDVQEVSEATGAPEMMGGRVKTLHPKIHGGILARRDVQEDKDAMEAHDIAPIDLVIVNLYPFAETVASGADEAACMEEIDIGAPAMIRGAAKNHAFVAVIVSPDDYAALMEEIQKDGCVSFAFRRRMAQKAFAWTAAYDAAIAEWLAHIDNADAPPVKVVSGRLKQTLRYGENPHQRGALYTTSAGGLAQAAQVQGKALSYNNIADADAACGLLREIARDDAGKDKKASVVIVKHANPCGVAVRATLAEAYRAALACDKTSAFGGIVALGQTLDAETANAITQIFTEIVVAPDASDEARKILSAKKNLRLLLSKDITAPRARSETLHMIDGGFLAQDADDGHVGADDVSCVSKREPAPDEMQDLMFAWRVCKHVASNAIVLVNAGASVGIGAGQMSRIDSARIAVEKAGARAKGSVAASDAFFPFADGVEQLARAGVRAVIHPGGSVRDNEVITAADTHDLAMLFTNMRHFKH